MNAPIPGGLAAVKAAAQSSSGKGESGDRDGVGSIDGVKQALLSLSSSPELREAVVAELVTDLAKAAEAVHDIERLLRVTDEQLTGRLEEIRQASEEFVAVAVRHEAAFKGELAVRAAQLARREALDALSSELVKLQQLISLQNRPRTSWRACQIFSVPRS